MFLVVQCYENLFDQEWYFAKPNKRSMTYENLNNQLRIETSKTIANMEDLTQCIEIKLYNKIL